MLVFLRKTIQFFLILALSFTIKSSVIFAQVLDTTSVQSPSIELTMSPESPKAGDGVTLTISSYSINLDTSKITWYIDGVAKSDSIGQKSLVIKAKNSGQNTTIKVVAKTADGITAQVNKDIIPAGVDLVVEPTSYVPPFYKGKPLFISQGVARIVAIPDVVTNGKKVSSKNLIFKWTSNNTNLTLSSGAGKDSIVINGTVPIRDIDVSVEVLDSSGNILATNATTISAENPGVLFYENNPLYGILYNKAIIASYYLGLKNEVTITAKPFFFNIDSDTSKDILYKWTINGNPVTLSGKVNELLLKQTDVNLKGTASVKLDVNNNSKIFQFTNSGFNVDFGQ